jgi:hypothetical protein
MNISRVDLSRTLTWDIPNEHQQVRRQLLRCMQILYCCRDCHFSSMELTALMLAFGAEKEEEEENSCHRSIEGGNWVSHFALSASYQMQTDTKRETNNKAIQTAVRAVYTIDVAAHEWTFIFARHVKLLENYSRMQLHVCVSAFGGM